MLKSHLRNQHDWQLNSAVQDCHFHSGYNPDRRNARAPRRLERAGSPNKDTTATADAQAAL
jgi:hypothetical protein